MSELKKLAGPVAIALICAALLTGTNKLTSQRIDANYTARERSLLRELLGPGVSTEMLENTTWEQGHLDFCALQLTVSRFSSPGYSGPIQGLVAWQPEQSQLTGIRITRHLETPGIADFLADHSAGSWLFSLLDLATEELLEIDTVSGATISSAAVQRGVAGILKAGDAAISRCRT